MDLTGEIKRDWGNTDSEGFAKQGYDCLSDSDFDSDLVETSDDFQEDESQSDSEAMGWTSDDDVNEAILEQVDHDSGDEHQHHHRASVHISHLSSLSSTLYKDWVTSSTASATSSHVSSYSGAALLKSTSRHASSIKGQNVSVGKVISYKEGGTIMMVTMVMRMPSIIADSYTPEVDKENSIHPERRRFL